MKLATAIYRINLVMGLSSLKGQEEFQAALQLGIEALTRISTWRDDNDEDLLWDLPGETED